MLFVVLKFYLLIMNLSMSHLRMILEKFMMMRTTRMVSNIYACLLEEHPFSRKKTHFGNKGM